MSEEIVPDYLKKRVLILGVGNILFGDDGFGPAVANYLLEKCRTPNDVYVLDAGIGASEVLVTVGLSQERPKKIIILDAVDAKRKPGEIFELSIDELPTLGLGFLSMHLFPTVNLLKELRDEMNVDIVILACQVEHLPDVVSPGLSNTLNCKLLAAAETALKLAANTS